MSHEDRFILEILNPTWLHQKVPYLNRLLKDVKPEILIARANYHGLSPILYYLLRKAAPGNSKFSFLLEKLRKEYIEQTAITMAYDNLLSGVQTILSEEAVEFIVFKGYILANLIYPEPNTRPFSDIDILIRKRDFHKTVRILRENGFIRRKFTFPDLPESIIRKYEFSFHLHKKDNIPLNLDIHTNLCESLHPFYFPVEEFWKNTRNITVKDTEITILGAENLLISQCIHVLKHFFFKLIWIYDVHRIIETLEIDWNKLIEFTRKHGISKVVFWTFILSRELFDTAVPDYILSQLSPSKLNMFTVRRFLTEGAIFRGSIPLGDFSGRILLPLLLMKGPSQWFSFFLKTAFPPLEVLEDFYSSKRTSNIPTFYIANRLKAFFYSLKSSVLQGER